MERLVRHAGLVPPVGARGAHEPLPVDLLSRPYQGVMKKAGHRDRIEQVGMAVWGIALTASFAWWIEPLRWIRERRGTHP